MYSRFKTDGEYSHVQNTRREQSSTRKGKCSLEHEFFTQLQFGLYMGVELEGVIEIKAKKVDNEFLNTEEDVTLIPRSLYFDNWQFIVELVFYIFFSKFSKEVFFHFNVNNSFLQRR